MATREPTHKVKNRYLPVCAVNYLERCLEACPPEFKYDKDVFIEFIYRIVGQVDTDRSLFDTMVYSRRLSSRFLQSSLDRNYNKYRIYLENIGLISISNYVANSRSMNYTLNKKYSDGNWLWYSTKNSKFIKHDQDLINKHNHSSPETLRRQAKLKHFKIDAKKSKYYVSTALSKSRNKPYTDKQLGIFNKQISDIKNKSCVAYKDWIGREHSQFTNSISEIVDNFITCDGERIAGIDIPTSQWHFLLLHISKSNRRNIRSGNI